jgi:type IV secretion system protein VirB10
LTIILLAAGVAAAQSSTAPSDPVPAAQSSAPSQDISTAQTAPGVRQITIPADTEVLLSLKNAIDTKNARVGDGVYCQTTFPVVIDNTIVIPAGSYVKGQITKVQRAGKVSGRAEILFHFTSVIFPSGYTVEMPGSLHGDPGTTKARISDDEGTVKTDGHDKLKQLPEVGRDAGYGAVGGAIATGTVNGARIGGGIGAAAGLATMILTRGADVRIEPGAALMMRLQRPLVVDVTNATAPAETQVVPRDTNNRLRVVPSASKPQ